MTDDISQAPDEREAIVRWLREQARCWNKRGDDLDNQWRSEDYNHASHLADAADAIEAGRHLSEQGEGYE